MRIAARETSTVRRLGKNESGMTLGLTMIIIVMIGVMGAGLLTFATTDLSTVLEVNRGQRAFEVADAGVGFAKRQLTKDCQAATPQNPCIDHYDDLNGGNYQWSAVNGVRLNDLDGDLDPRDYAIVTIDYRYQQDDFKIVSTGNYGVAQRKIEAIFKGVSGIGTGSGIGHPIYYTPSSIEVQSGNVTLKGISLFSTRDILLRDLPCANTSSYPSACKGSDLKDDLETNGGIFQSPNTKDALKCWKSDSACFDAANRGNWNTTARMGRTGYKSPCDKPAQTCEQPGLAAQGKICVLTSTETNVGTCGTKASVADGVYGYDSTTGPDLAPLDSVTGYPEVCPKAADPDNTRPLAERGNNLTFCAKDPPTQIPQDGTTITFPFPRPTPNELRLRGYAQTQPSGNRYWNSQTQGCTPNWDTLMNGGADQVVFVDAGACSGTLNYGTSNSGNNQGILVVWCGDLKMTQQFSGIILNLWGDTLPGGSTCGPDRGTFKNDGQTFRGWLYAEGGTATKPGIVIGPNSDIGPLSGASFNFFNDAFSGGPPTSVEIQGWRELYQ
jgi:hypothetical protein